MRQVIYRDAFYHSLTGVFSHYSLWGEINHKGDYDPTCFIPPSSNNFSERRAWEIYTGHDDSSGTRIFEGSILRAKGMSDTEDGQTVEVLWDTYKERLVLRDWAAGVDFDFPEDLADDDVVVSHRHHRRPVARGQHQ